MTTLPFMPPCNLPVDRLVLARPGTIGRIVLTAIREWNGFGQHVISGARTVKVGKKEHQAGYRKKVGVYWKVGTGQSYDGSNRDVAWSATFISYVMKMSGVSPLDFERSIRHSEYIYNAIQAAKRESPFAAFVGHPIKDYSPKIGDLVAYSRTDKPMTFQRAAKSERYKSHTDIVVYVRQGEIGVIGGNVGDSVALKRVKTDASGRVKDKHHDWFAVLENRLPQA